MRYLIIPKIGTPFFTNCYEYENNWSDDYLMNIHGDKYSIDGKTWENIEND